MIYALCFASFMTFVAVISLWPRRVTRLKKLGHPFKRIDREVRILNKLNVKLPSTRRQPDLYIKWLGRLHKNPKCKLNQNADPYEKLFYAYACAKLFKITTDNFKKRQYYKNSLYAFAKPIKTYRTLVLSKRNTLFATIQPRFKFTQSGFIPRTDVTRFSHSYTVTRHSNAQIKNYMGSIENHTNIQCVEISGAYRFSYSLCRDKFRCVCSHMSDVFYCVAGNSVTAIYITGLPKINFETSIAEATQVMNLYINIKNKAKIFVIKSDTKKNAQVIIQKIKHNNDEINYLLSPHEIRNNRKIETLYLQSIASKYITGEKLKARIMVTKKLVPTINLPTLVYDIADPNELFHIIDNFVVAKTIAGTGYRLNIVALYSSQNDAVRELVATFTTRNDVRELVKFGVYVFFVDRITAPNDAIYYFSSMLNSPAPKRISTSPLILISRKGVSYTTTDLVTFTTKYHKLLPNTHVVDQYDNILKVGQEAICSDIKVISIEKTRASKALAKKLPTKKPSIARLKSADRA